MIRIFLFFLCFLFAISSSEAQNIEIVVLGIAQDAGFPQANCSKKCCSNPDDVKMVTSLALVDHSENKYYLIDCTPDFREQINLASKYLGQVNTLPSGIFLTHAHIGHYLGLVQLGKEVINTSNIPVHVMPRMFDFLSTNAPWEMLVSQNNIKLNGLSDQRSIKLSKNLSIKPILVPHRDEYSETVAYLVESKREALLYIPDIDKWGKWDRDIIDLIRNVDYALLDGTFYADGELPGRNMADIPHPFVKESMKLFEDLSPLDRSKVHFIHLNHTNPLLNKKSKAFREVYLKGFNVADEGLSYLLD